MHFQVALSTTPKMTFEVMRCTLSLKKLFVENTKLLTGFQTIGGTSTVAVYTGNDSQEVLPALYGEQYPNRPERYLGNRGRGRESHRGNYQFTGN